MKQIRYIWGLIIPFILCGSCSDDDTPSLDASMFRQTEDFVDERDGTTYRCMQVGNQIWMMDNLRYHLPLGAYEGCYTWGEEKIVSAQISITMSNDDFKELYASVINDPNHDWEAEIGVTNAVLEGYISMLERYGGWPGFVNMFKSWKPAFYNAIMQSMDETKYSPNNPYFKEHMKTAEEFNGKYSETYGYLYSLEAARKAVPDGWRLPSDEDWKRLEIALGMPASEVETLNAWRGERCGDYLKENGEALFDARMGGCNAFAGNGKMQYIRLLECCYFWADEERTVVSEEESASEDEGQEVTHEGIIRQLAIYSSQIWRGTTRIDCKYRPTFYSVRCVKDAN